MVQSPLFRWEQVLYFIWKQIKLRWALFVTYTIIQSIMRSEMCSLHLTHPSGAVGSRHCSARGAVGGLVPCSRVSPQSWTLPGFKPTTSDYKSNALSIRPWLPQDLNYFSLCALNLFNTRVSQFELNYWNKWTFPRHSNTRNTRKKDWEILL